MKTEQEIQNKIKALKDYTYSLDSMTKLLVKLELERHIELLKWVLE